MEIWQIYGVEAIRLREQVRRNIEKFPSHFMFQLNDAEVDIMVSQNAIPSRQYLGEHCLTHLQNMVCLFFPMYLKATWR
ncbi:ORF6N domain-containing protein [Olivibacter sp. XZL3]|uniref:ORF6N domain-containing protein n=1 Tax=Olivibacter sp. XZL3 TaxID=1735116 RepID=UPI00351A2C21